MFELVDGKIITDERIAEKLNIIAKERPELKSETETVYEWDERGMSELFALCYSDECRYCIEKKSWYNYNNGVWVKDDAGLFTMGKLTEFTRLLAMYVPCIKDQEKRNGYYGFVRKLGDRRFRDRIMRDAVNNLIISATEFDNNPYLINCKNGTYNLQNGTNYEHNPKDLLTKKTNFEYYPEQKAKCKKWEKFIDDIMQGDAEKIKHLQKAAGYSMLGMCNEECMFVLYGRTTRNGKSTFLNSINYLLGDYADVSPVSIICKSQVRNAETATPMLASLKGKRFVTMAESQQYGRFDEEAIKQLTGGEEIKARNLYQKPITFLPQFTLWLSCNDLPMFNDKSIILSDRIHIITFDRHFTQKEQDKKLKQYFCQAENMPAIFEWLLKGYRMYVEEGLTMPVVVQDAVSAYSRDNDLVLQFLEDVCTVDEGGSVKGKNLYESYKNWCRNNGSYVCTARKFYSELDTHTDWYEHKTNRGNYIYYNGLQFKGGAENGENI